MLQTFSDTTLNKISFTEFDLADFNEARFADNLHDLISDISLKDLPIEEVNAFIMQDSEWTKYSFIDHEIRYKSFDINSDPKVETALENDIAFAGIPFFGKADDSRIYFNIPVPRDFKLVITATLRRSGLIEVIRDQSSELTGGLIILIIFSFILGRIFAASVTRPLRKLSANALKISDGDHSVRLPLKRRDEIGVLSRALGQMNQDLEERLKAMEIMNRIDKAVLSSISRNDLLNRVIGFVCDYIDKSTAVMALRDDRGGGFELVSAVNQSGAAILMDTPYIPDELLSRDTMAAFKNSSVFEQDRNLTEVLIKQLRLPKNTRRFYNVALYLREEYLGSLLVIKEDQNPFTDEQQHTLRKLGDQVGVAMQSVMAVEEINSLQIGSIQALSRAIDAKSKWTAGHSGRVAELSELLGKAIGLEEMELRRLVISALLHDIGKIGISEAILDKPGKLTDEEFGLIKQHPDLGWEISHNIPDYEDICDGIRYHHERWDGSGYPIKLSGKDIPQFGRIIAIADVFDALSADRPYRKGLCYEACISFINDRKGTDFDAEYAGIFIESLKNTKSQIII